MIRALDYQFADQTCFFASPLYSNWCAGKTQILLILSNKWISYMNALFLDLRIICFQMTPLVVPYYSLQTNSTFVHTNQMMYGSFQWMITPFSLIYTPNVCMGTKERKKKSIDFKPFIQCLQTTRLFGSPEPSIKCFLLYCI